MSIRRSHGGMWPSSATSSRSGSGPPSTSRRPPRDPSTRIPSPWPTSRIVTRGDGRRARHHHAADDGDRDDEGQRRRALCRPAGRRPVGAGRGSSKGRRLGEARQARCLDLARRCRHQVSPSNPPVETAAATSVERRREVQAGKRHGRRADDDRVQDAEQHPAWSRQDRAECGRSAERDQGPAGHRHEPDGHRRRDERHDREIDRGCQDRQPTERNQYDRERRRLGGQRHAQALRQPARHPPVADRPDPVGQRRGPGDQSGGRERRELEPRVADEPGVGEEQEHRRPAERGGGPAGPARLPREQDHAGHQRGPNDRCRRARKRDVRGDGHDRDDGASPPPEASGERGDGRRHDRDVPTRDGDDVTHAGRGECRRQVAVDTVAQADQDSGRQPGLGLGQHPGKRLARSPSQFLEAAPGIRRRRAHAKVLRRQRSDRTDPREVVTVGRLGPRPDLPLHGDAVAGHEFGVPRERGRHGEGRAGARRGRQGHGLVPVARRSRGCHDQRPRSFARRRLGQGHRSRLDDGQSQGDQPGAHDHRPSRPRSSRGAHLTEQEQPGHREGDRGREVVAADPFGGHGGCDGADRDPCAATHLNAPSRGP